MQNPSRRFFLGGRAPELSAWEQCLVQLRQKALAVTAHEQTVVSVLTLKELHYVRQLCHGLGIRLSLWGKNTAAAAELRDEEVLHVDVSALNQLEPIDELGQRWFVQAGASVAQLKAVGFEGLDVIPEGLTLTAWLANPDYHHYDLSAIDQSGLVHASLLQADGSVSSLGPFGAQNTKPLNTVFLQQLVPQLFMLANTEVAQKLLEHEPWLGTFRLDVLSAQNSSPNLAHLLLGHQGALGAIEWVVLDKTQYMPAPHRDSRAEVDPLLGMAAQELDAAVRQLFDADGLFFT